MERVLCVTVRALAASFRRPLDHNYQRTLSMPPPTTLLGIAGAALGLSDRELWAEDSPLQSAKVAVWMDSEPGRARDMWTVLKIKSGKIAERSPYFREMLFFARYTLLYGGDEALLERLDQAFRDPVYPLSLGREDELLIVEDVHSEIAMPGKPIFTGTVIPGDFREMASHFYLRSNVRFEPPIVEKLPLGFRVDPNGVRRPIRPVSFTFCPLQLELEVSQLASSALQLRGRNFIWMNS